MSKCCATPLRELSARLKNAAARQFNGRKARRHAAWRAMPETHRARHDVRALLHSSWAWRPENLLLAVDQAMLVQILADGAAAEVRPAIGHFLPALAIALRDIAGSKRIRGAQAQRKQKNHRLFDHIASPFYQMDKQPGRHAIVAPPRADAAAPAIT